jgi:ABC-2 type transport system permease protein
MKGSLPYLIGYRLIMIRNMFRKPTRETLTKLAISIVLGGLFVTGDYLFFVKILNNIKNQQLGILEIVLVTRLMTMVFLTFLSMLIFSNIITSISTTYLSEDLALLLSSPISIRSIAGSKFIEAIINSSWLVLLAGIPIFVAYGRVNQAPLWFYGWILCVILPFLVFPAALGSLITMLLMRFFPAKRTHQILTVLGIIFISTLIILFRLLKPEQLAKPMSPHLLSQLLETMRVPSQSYLPSTWATEALARALEGDFTVMMQNWLYLTGSALVSTIIVLLVASSIYFSGWSGSKESKTVSTRTTVQARESRFFHWWFSDIHLSTRSFLMKDTKLFFRDTSQWSQLLLLGALIILYLFNIKLLPFKEYELLNLVSFINLTLSNLVMAGVAVRFLYPAVSLEGKCFWIIHSSPISYRRFLWEKFFLFIIPLLVLGEIISITSNMILDVDRYMMTLSITTNCAIVLGLAGLGVGLGAKYPKFDAENPAQIAVGLGGILYMIFSLIFILLITVALLRPVFVHYYQPYSSIRLDGWDVKGAYLAAILLCALVTYIPMRIGEKALSNLEL